MARFTKKNKNEIGRAPDELFFRGKQKVDNVQLKIIDFNAESLEETSVTKINEVLKYKESNSVTWFNVNGLHNTNIISDIGSVFELDSLILSDVMDTNSRSKSHEYATCITVSIKMLQLNEKTGLISVENLSLILTKSVLVSFQEVAGDVFDPVRERIRNKKRRIRTSGTDYLMYALLDIVIDNYIYIISNLGTKIENLEEALLGNPNQVILEEINCCKRELNFLRKNINPTKEMLLTLAKMETDLISEANDIHYKELLYNINHAIESSESYREILSDQLNIYHTTISTKLNDIMKFLTVFSVVFIPLTFIAGIYGTNFEFVPELKYKYSYFMMWGVMIVIAVAMLFYFRRKKWL